jgi:N-acetylmuramoyl-L-alanine amidase
VCGVDEKDVTLAVANELAALLWASGRASPLLTRQADTSVSLQARAELANRAGAALFVSIHANASKNGRARGVETFFLSSRAATRRHRHLVERENEGHGRAGSAGSPLDTILNGLRLSAAHQESQRFAVALQEVLRAEIGAQSRGVMQAPFLVLMGAQMAAALVEVGFLTHEEECVLLGSVAHQRRIARAIAAAIFAHLAESAAPLWADRSMAQ